MRTLHMLDLSKLQQKKVMRVIEKLPDKALDFCCKNCMVISNPSLGAYMLKLDQLKSKKYLIFLGEYLFKNDFKLFELVFLHGVAHCFLGHKGGRNPKYERLATRTAQKWLDEIYGK